MEVSTQRWLFTELLSRALFSFCSRFLLASKRGGGQGNLQQQRQSPGPTQEATEGPDGLYGPSTGAIRAQLRAPEVLKRPGPYGAGSFP